MVVQIVVPESVLVSKRALSLSDGILGMQCVDQHELYQSVIVLGMLPSAKLRQMLEASSLVEENVDEALQFLSGVAVCFGRKGSRGFQAPDSDEDGAFRWGVWGAKV